MEQNWFSISAIVRPWLTPALLFLLLNFFIGAIALTSKTLLDEVLHRLRSLSLPRFRSADSASDPTNSSLATEILSNNSDEMKQTAEEEKSPAVKMNGGLEDVTVDARAEDFISRFRRQLHLQRLDSLLKYKEILNRGN